MRLNRVLSIFTVIALAVSALTVANAAPAPQGKAVGYWNQARLDSAQPIELVVDEETGIGKLRVNAQAGKPSKAPTTGTTVATTDWPQGAQIAQTAVGKVFFSVGTGNYVCSGALATDSEADRAIVLTAAHCAWSQGSPGAYVTNFAFIPNYEGDNRIAWYSSALIVPSEFASQSTFNTTAISHDWAFAVIRPGVLGNPKTLPDVDFQGVSKNSYDLNISGFTSGYSSFAFGYPQAKPFNGLTLKYAGSPIFIDSNTKTTWGMSSTMTGGASGGPWLSNGTSKTVDAVDGKLSSVNSYKYSRDSTKMYGPFFNSLTADTFTAALTAAGNKIVP